MSAIPADQEALWSDLKPLAERGDKDALLGEIKKIENDGERIATYRFVVRKLMFTPWENRNLDMMTAVSDACIADAELLAGDFLDQANIMCYNASANLCDCWNDGFDREPRHHEKGIAYAKKALWYRDHLGKGPARIAMAMWALGKHQQSLGQLEEARATFQKCVALEEEAARETGQPTEISTEASEGYIIARSYLALMDRNVDDLREVFRVLDEMEAQGGDPKQDAEIIRPQLITTGKQLGLDL